MHERNMTGAALRIVGRGATLALIAASGCRPGDVLSVPAPTAVVGGGTLQNQAGAESIFNGAKAQAFAGIAGGYELIQSTGLLTDEFTWSGFSFYGNVANIDARMTAIMGGFTESGDGPLQSMLAARSSMMIAIDGLRHYEPAAGRAKIGEAYALVGYAELLLAEDYCAGVPLSDVVPGGGIRYGMPLTTDSLLGTAEAHFELALANANGDAGVQALASLGLGRARLDRGHYMLAASAVQGVPTSFVYNTELQPSVASGGPSTTNLYASELAVNYGCGFFNVSDREGGNGLDFVSAQDPRLVLDSVSAPTCDGGTWYYPVKFGNPSTYVPLATGVEARLIEAEAALQAGPASAWASALNALRADAADTKVTFPPANQTIGTDSTTGASAAAQVDVMFRERAFWLFGTGTRLGDLRRLIRQYGRDPSTVFPTGPYPNGSNPGLPAPLPSYGADVDLTLPTPAGGTPITNPHYAGCLTPTTKA